MSQSAWERLGLPPGSGRDEIKRAYARKLKACNPEDDPDGFKALREAFDRANREADLGFHYPDEPGDEGEDEDSAWDEEEDWDDGQPVEWQGWHAPDLAEPPRGPGAGGEPGLPGSTIDVEERRHAHALEDRLGRLDALLTAEDPQPVEVLGEAFDAILASPALAELATRERTARWIAWRIASTLPRSDPLVEPALFAFGWNDLRREDCRDPAVARLLDRLEEWRFMDAAGRAGDPLHLGWLALTGPPAAEGKLRQEGLSRARAAQVQALLSLTDYQLPGLALAFEEGRLRWWQHYLEKPRLTFDTLLLGPLVVYLACLVPAPIPVALQLAILAALGVAAPWLYFRLVKRRHHEWETWQRPWPRPWIARGWMAAAALLPPAAMLMPASLGGTVALAVLAAAILVWMVTVRPPEQTTSTFLARVRVFIGRLWFLGVLAFFSIGAFSGYRLDQFLIMINTIAIVWWRGRDPMIWEVESLVPKWRQAAAAGFVAAAAGLTIGAVSVTAGSDRIYFAAMLILLCGPVLVIVWHLEGQANMFPLVLCWLLLGAVFFYAIPDAPGGGSAGQSTRAPSAAQRLVVTPFEGGWQRPQCPAAPEGPAVERPPIPCSPHQWVLAADPAEPRTRGFQPGAVSFLKVEVSETGAVSSCAPLGVPLLPALATAACDDIMVNARFLPGIDEWGLPAPASVEVQVDWGAGAAKARSPSPAVAAARRTDAEAPRAGPRPVEAIAPPPPPKCPKEEDPPKGPLPLRPCGTFSAWMNNADYPAESLRQGEEGISRVLLRVTEEGRASRCTVEKSSGSATLDRATCDVMMKRGRFLPARNEAGEAIPTNLTFTMEWKLER